jgi:hypothetical protein
MEPSGGTTVGVVESLLTSSRFRKGAESRRRHRICGARLSGGASHMGCRSCSLRHESARGRVMMAPPVDWLVCALGWAMWKLLQSRG